MANDGMHRAGTGQIENQQVAAYFGCWKLQKLIWIQCFESGLIYNRQLSQPGRAIKPIAVSAEHPIS